MTLTPTAILVNQLFMTSSTLSNSCKPITIIKMARLDNTVAMHSVLLSGIFSSSNMITILKLHDITYIPYNAHLVSDVCKTLWTADIKTKYSQS